jgi:hypothetical protein
MRLILFAIFLSVSLLLISCEEGETTVGSNQDTLISNLSFTVDTTYLDVQNSKLVAKGVVRNFGNAQVTSPWYVECQFYTNSSRTTKLGGNYTQIGVPLSNGQSTFWTITYSSTNVNVNDYPDFAIGDLRGIYK